MQSLLRLSCGVALAWSVGCGLAFHEAIKPSESALRQEQHAVQVMTEPPGAELFLQNGNKPPQPYGNAPAQVLVPYEVKGGSSVAAKIGFGFGTLIDLGLTGGLGYYTATTDDSKVLPVIGMLVMGVALLADLGTIISDDNVPTVTTQDIKLVARLKDHDEVTEKVSIPGTLDLHLSLPQSALALANQAQAAVAVARQAFGKTLVLEVRAGRGLPSDLTKLITTMSASELQRHNEDTVLGLADVDAMLRADRVKDALGCNDVACYAEIGGQLGTKLVLAGDVEQADSFIIFSYRLIDTRGGSVAARYSHREQVSGNTEDAVIRSIPAAIAGLVGSLQP